MDELTTFCSKKTHKRKINVSRKMKKKKEIFSKTIRAERDPQVFIYMHLVFYHAYT